MEDRSRWHCPLCTCFASVKLKGVVKHVGRVHGNDANFHINCGINGCARSYKKFQSYKKHMYKCHFKVFGSSSVDAQPDQNSDGFENYPEVDNDTNNLDNNNEQSLTYNKKLSALFLMKLSHSYKMSNTAVDGIIGDISDLLEMKIESVQSNVVAILLQKGITLDAGELTSVFENTFIK